MATVVQTAAGSATSLYGIGTTAVSTAEGSWLALLAGWNTGVISGSVTTAYVSTPALRNAGACLLATSAPDLVALTGPEPG